MRTFRLLVANTLVASTTNMYLWFALTFWVYLETESVTATSIIGGGYMLLYAASGLAFGSYVDRHERKTSMLASTTLSLVLYALAGAVYLVAPAGAASDLGHPSFWMLVVLVLAGAIAGNLRAVALSTTVTMLVPPDEHDRANGLVGTVNGVSFAITSVFSGLSIGLLGMGPTLAIGVGLTAACAAHLMTIRVDEQRVQDPDADAVPTVDVKGALRAVGTVPGLWALLYFSTFNNLLAGAFMALMDPYGLMLVSVEAWGIVLALTSSGFIIGGILVATKGLGPHPVRALLLTNAAMWTITALFPVRSSIVLLGVGFLVYMTLIPRAEAAEQTVIQRVVPFEEQGRVFGFAQTFEMAASPITSFLLGPITQVWIIPFMTDGAGADAIGSWFGTGADRAIALVFIVSGLLGLAMTAVALRSKAFRRLSDVYAAAREPAPASGGQRRSST